MPLFRPTGGRELCTATLNLILAMAMLPAAGSAAGATIPPEGLVVYYPFNGDAIDESGNGHDGLLVGGVTPTTDRRGHASRAFFFDGVNGRIDIPHSPALDYVGSDSMSVSAWVKLAEPIANLGPILCKGGSPGDGVGGSSYCTPFSASGQPRAYINHYPNGQPFSGLESDTAFTPGVWYHIVVLFAAHDVAIYVNAELDTSTVFSSSPVLNSDPLHVGLDADGLDEYFHGALDDICIYDRVLSQSEIESLYAEPVALEGTSWGRVKAMFR